MNIHKALGIPEFLVLPDEAAQKAIHELKLKLASLMEKGLATGARTEDHFCPLSDVFFHSELGGTWATPIGYAVLGLPRPPKDLYQEYEKLVAEKWQAKREHETAEFPTLSAAAKMLGLPHELLYEVQVEDGSYMAVPEIIASLRK
jgi:hypothetical protein